MKTQKHYVSPAFEVENIKLQKGFAHSINIGDKGENNLDLWED